MRGWLRSPYCDFKSEYLRKYLRMCGQDPRGKSKQELVEWLEEHHADYGVGNLRAWVKFWRNPETLWERS